MTSIDLKKKVANKLAEARKIADHADTRDLSPEEKAQFDGLMADVAALKDQVAKLSALESEEQEASEPEAYDAPERSLTHVAPAVHTKRHRYSVLRAIRALAERKKVDGLEGEISRDIAIRSKKEPQGFYMPSGAEPEYRDLTTTTGTGAVFIAPELPFIELLRNRTVVKQLGATFLTGMVGKFSIPRQSASDTAYWVTETTAVTASNQTLDQVAFVDKTLGAYTDLSRKFVYQSSVDAEAFVKEDMARVLAIEVDRAAINGSGSGAIPIGILQNSTVTTNSSALALGSNGGVPTYANLVAMETQVAGYNADRGKLAYLTSPANRGKLKSTPKVGSSTYPVFCWEGANVYDAEGFPVGEINGYKAVASNQVPSNLTKGSVSSLSACIFGNWEDLVIAQWGGIDIILNPYSNSTTGALRVVMLAEFDLQLRHPESFAVVSDIITA